MKKAEKFVAERDRTEFATTSKAAYKQYKQDLKSSSMFKSEKTANAALINVVRVQIPKAIDMISNLQKKQSRHLDKTFEKEFKQLTDEIDKLSALDDKRLVTKKGHEALTWPMCYLDSFSYRYIKDKKIKTLIQKILAFYVEYSNFKMLDVEIF